MHRTDSGEGVLFCFLPPPGPAAAAPVRTTWAVCERGCATTEQFARHDTMKILYNPFDKIVVKAFGVCSGLCIPCGRGQWVPVVCCQSPSPPDARPARPPPRHSARARPPPPPTQARCPPPARPGRAGAAGSARPHLPDNMRRPDGEPDDQRRRGRLLMRTVPRRGGGVITAVPHLPRRDRLRARPPPPAVQSKGGMNQHTNPFVSPENNLFLRQRNTPTPDIQHQPNSPPQRPPPPRRRPPPPPQTTTTTTTTTAAATPPQK